MGAKIKCLANLLNSICGDSICHKTARLMWCCDIGRVLLGLGRNSLSHLCVGGEWTRADFVAIHIERPGFFSMDTIGTPDCFSNHFTPRFMYWAHCSFVLRHASRVDGTLGVARPTRSGGEPRPVTQWPIGGRVL
jgi:hypothetical protein